MKLVNDILVYEHHELNKLLGDRGMTVYEECDVNPLLMLKEVNNGDWVATCCEKCNEPKVFNMFNKKDRPDLDDRLICKNCRQKEDI